MGLGWYGKWMTRWETDLTTRDTNRIVRPLEWGFEWLADFAGGCESVAADSGAKSVPQGLKPNSTAGFCGTAEAVPLTKTGAAVVREVVAVSEQVPGAKAHLDAAAAMPGLKSRPISGTGSSAAAGSAAGTGSTAACAAIALADEVGGAQRGDSAASAAASARLRTAPHAGGGFQDDSAGGHDIDRMIALNEEMVRCSDDFFGYATPTDFRIEQRHPELFPTNVRPETLAKDAEMKRQAAAGELDHAEFLRFTSPVRTPYPENDQVNARWYPVPAERVRPGRPKQALIVMPQWNADALSHNIFGTLANRFGVAALRLSKPYHDIRRPAELERSDYAMSANIGRTISACRQAVVDIRSCMDWLETQGYTQFGVLGTSLGSCYAFIAAAHDPRLQVCAFNHASTWVGDVVWEGQSTRHVRAGFEEAGLTQEQVRRLFLGVSPRSYMERFAAAPKTGVPGQLAGWGRKRVLVVHATYDLTFPLHLSLDVLTNFERCGIDFESRVLPCGHYTTGETPFKYLDGWYLGSFIYRAFRDLAERG